MDTWFDKLFKDIRQEGWNEGWDEGWDKGWDKGNINGQQEAREVMVRNLLKENVSLDTIARVSGLTAEAIREMGAGENTGPR